jgi:hypothetical protein
MSLPRKNLAGFFVFVIIKKEAAVTNFDAM